jgi:hypothetical protein
MVRASYFRRQAKSPLFLHSVGGKYYARKPASWMDWWRGWAAFLESGVGTMRCLRQTWAPELVPTFFHLSLVTWGLFCKLRVLSRGGRWSELSSGDTWQRQQESGGQVYQ